MKNFKYDFSVSANSPSEADEKMKALAKLAKSFPASHLSALAHKGPGLINGSWGGMIKKQLGIQ